MKLKLDMSPEAIERRLHQVEDLREVCLSLADTDIGRRILEKNPDNPIVRRTAQALGDKAKQ